MQDDCENSVTVHNADKKIVQLVKVIFNMEAALEDTKVQKETLDKFIDEKSNQITTEYNNSFIKNNSELQSLSQNISIQYSDLYLKKYNDLIFKYKQFSTIPAKNINEIDNKMMGELQELISTINEANANIEIIFKESAEGNTSGKLLTKEMLQEMNRLHELEMKKFIRESDIKYEDYLKKSEERFKDMIEYYNTEVEKNRPSEKPVIPKMIKTYFVQTKKDLIEMKKELDLLYQKVKNSTSISNTNLTAFRSRLQSAIETNKDTDIFNKDTFMEMKHEFDDAQSKYNTEYAQMLLNQENREYELSEEVTILESELLDWKHKVGKLNKQLEDIKKIHEQKKNDMLMLTEHNLPGVIKDRMQKIEKECQHIEEKNAQLALKLDETERDNIREHQKFISEFEKLSKSLSDERSKFFSDQINAKNAESIQYERQREILAQKLQEKHKDDKEYQKSLLEKERLAAYLERIANDHIMAMRAGSVIIDAEIRSKKENFDRIIKERTEKHESDYNESSQHHEKALSKYEIELAEAYEKYKQNLERTHKKALKNIQIEESQKEGFDENSMKIELSQLEEIYSGIEIPEYQNEQLDLSPLIQRVEETRQFVQEEKETLIKNYENQNLAEKTRHSVIQSHGNNIKSKNLEALKKVKERGQKELMALKVQISNLKDDLTAQQSIKTNVRTDFFDDELNRLRAEKANLEVVFETSIAQENSKYDQICDLIKNQIKQQKVKSMNSYIELEKAQEADYNIIKAKFKDELHQRSQISVILDNKMNELSSNYQNNQQNMIEDFEKNSSKIRTEITKETKINKEMPEKHQKELEISKKALERRNTDIMKNYENDIQMLRKTRANALDDISLSVEQASANLENAAGRVRRRSPRSEEQAIIDVLTTRLEEVTEELSTIGREMLLYHDGLLERDPNYSAPFKTGLLQKARITVPGFIPIKQRLSATLPRSSIPPLI